QKLAQAWRLGLDHVVGQHDRKRFVTHQLQDAEHRVPQPQGFLLPHIRYVDQVGYAADDAEQLLLRARLQQIFQLEAHIEMIFDGRLAAAGDDDDVLEDRKSTRLNSSHVAISYAVFCLKKKKTRRSGWRYRSQPASL